MREEAVFFVDDRGCWWGGIIFLGEEAHVLAGCLVGLRMLDCGLDSLGVAFCFYVCLQWRLWKERKREREKERMDRLLVVGEMHICTMTASTGAICDMVQSIISDARDGMKDLRELVSCILHLVLQDTIRKTACRTDIFYCLKRTYTRRFRLAYREEGILR